MRVIAGSARGRPLDAPRGRAVRPTSDRVREALFSALSDDVPGAAVLDLFAGSGALAIEALSRGADLAVLIESDPTALNTIRANLKRAGVADRAKVIRADALAWTPAWTTDLTADRPRRPDAGTPTPFDVVLVDPPYALPLPRVLKALERLAEAGVLVPGARVVVERDRRDPDLDRPLPGPRLLLDRDRTYGDTVLRWLRVQEEA